MFFNKEEKVFSLSETSTAAPSRDIKTLWEELYCFLFLAGLMREGEGVEGVHIAMSTISDKDFDIYSGSYQSSLARLIAIGLKRRFDALQAHTGISEHERNILKLIDRLFVNDKAWTLSLSGNDLYGIALGREFTASMTSIARYVAVMFGRHNYPDLTSVPWIYLSALGNIHLSLETLVELGKPELPYGSRLENGQEVTALWALVSAQLGTISKNERPGDLLGDMLSHLSFMTDPCQFEKSIPLPTHASSLYMRRVMGLDDNRPIPVVAAFYQSFLYGNNEQRTLSRVEVLRYLIDLMVRKMGVSHFDLYAPNSYYRKLTAGPRLGVKPTKRPSILQFALEVLDSDIKEEDDIDPTSEETIEDIDPQVEDGGYDPSAPAPVTMENGNNVGMNNIGLISFNKTGEGVDEHLYRIAVVALNDKLKADDTLSISAEAREALNYWVNSYLFLAAISSTKDYMVALGLQKYLKNI